MPEKNVKIIRDSPKTAELTGFSFMLTSDLSCIKSTTVIGFSLLGLLI